MICPLSKITGDKSSCDKEECTFWILAEPPGCLLRIVLEYKFLEGQAGYKAYAEDTEFNTSLVQRKGRDEGYG